MKAARTILLSLLLVTTWALVHHYRLIGDGELYALQAMSRIDPALRADIYLAAHSQDELTLFSPLYAFAIRWLGLWNAGCALFALCTLTFLASCWTIARKLWDEKSAWLAAALLSLAASGYGAYNVFHTPETFLTARSMAEALVLASLATQYSGLIKTSWAIALIAMLIHPLMALPGILLLVCLSIPVMPSLITVGACVFFALWIAISASTFPRFPAAFILMSGPWLDMVRERSQFLFLQLWRLSDWELHARAFLCLCLAYVCTANDRVRRLCISAALVGAAGLAVGFIASCIGPVSILLQGQAWRWFWVTGCLSLLMVLPIAIRLWKEGGCGCISAVLMVGSWTFPPTNGALLAGGALAFFIVRKRVQPPAQRVVKILAFAILGIMIIWALADLTAALTGRPVQSSGEPVFIERLRSIFAMALPGLLVFALVLRCACSNQSLYVQNIGIVVLMVVCGFAIRGSFEQVGKIGTKAEIEAFSEWRQAIPARSNVLILPGQTSAAFAWFSLQRPSYMSMSQSAGVVFSPITAQEIRRRSAVLAAVEEPDWKIMSRINRNAANNPKQKVSHPLTAELLMSICQDEQLGFVVAKEDLGFGALQHHNADEWKDWNLYDCGKIRQAATPT